MIYNFNLGIGWASSGVEYAQAYRAYALRSVGQPAKFVFTNMFPKDNIQAMTKNIGFLDSEIIWLYTFFTDTRIEPVTYTLQDLEKTFRGATYTFERKGKKAYYRFDDETYYTVYLEREEKDLVHRVEIVSRECLIRKDYYTYCKIFSEYYAPLNRQAHLYARRFFNEDGSMAYEEMIDGKDAVYKFPDKILYSKEELIGYLVKKLELTKEDTVIIDRATTLGQTVMQNAGSARVGVAVHADHFSENGTDEENILWNNFYEYDFSQYRHVDFYIVATDAQNQMIRSQFRKYVGAEPNVVTIPVGGLTELKYPNGERKKCSLITASRLASEKHVDLLVEAVVQAHEKLPELTLDIYGEGEKKDRLKKLIDSKKCMSYVNLCGQQDLTDVYQNYEAYISGSMSEGFGLTLMEAVGAGLPIIGFDVRYGNQTFIKDGENGFLLPVEKDMSREKKVNVLAAAIEKLFMESDLESFHACSYEMAGKYLMGEIGKAWQSLIS